MKSTIPADVRSSSAARFVRILREGAFPALRLMLRPSTLRQIPRLLREGPGPAQRMFIQAHNNREIARLIREQVPVTFVCSYYRSGMTWLCYLLCDVLLQNQGIETTTELPVDPNKIILHYYAELIVHRDTTIQTPGYIIRTHDLMSMLQEHVHGDKGLRKCKYLYVYRNPEDTLVSTFHLYRREKWLRGKSGSYDDIDDFCLKFLSGWIEHVNCYLAALDEGVDVRLVSYDQLLRQTRDVLSGTLHWLDIPHTEAAVARADSNMQFKNLQAMEAKKLGDKGKRGFPYSSQRRSGKVPFFRRGSDGSGDLELKPQTLSKIRDATKDIFARANESLARQSAGRAQDGSVPAPH